MKIAVRLRWKAGVDPATVFAVFDILAILNSGWVASKPPRVLSASLTDPWFSAKSKI